MLIDTNPTEFNGIYLLLLLDGEHMPLLMRTIKTHWIKERNVKIPKIGHQVLRRNFLRFQFTIDDHASISSDSH